MKDFVGDSQDIENVHGSTAIEQEKRPPVLGIVAIDNFGVKILRLH